MSKEILEYRISGYIRYKLKVVNLTIKSIWMLQPTEFFIIQDSADVIGLCFVNAELKVKNINYIN